MEMGTSMMMLIIFVLGAVLFWQSGKIDEKTKNCTDTKVRNASKGLLVISVMFMTASASYLTCTVTNSKCQGPSGPPSNLDKLGPILYAIFFSILGVTITTLGGIIHGSDMSTCKDAKGEAGLVIGGGTIMTALMVGFLGFKGYAFFNKNYIPKGLDAGFSF